ncbi:sigma-70 family RNA polymerase sigma factor [Derxia lacustris]|uniref:sigma-70 family RNA polymerase sigma factor n=1 Tax=Derxia lacustris TaxID=764842 RepID=UPI000A177AB6|nr:sigma-70 family RNA polymerase sigma factor [Derxia lacustris]
MDDRDLNVIDPTDLRRFELLAMPHLDAAYNLARWLTRNDSDAEDVVQEATLRALRYFAGFRGDNARAWLLQIVRNTCFSWLSENRPAETVALDDSADADWRELPAPAADEPQAIALRSADRARINRALAELPIAYREVLVLRELEDLSYKEIATIADLPIGTVMSRLSRARLLMRAALEPDARPRLHAVGTASKGKQS